MSADGYCPLCQVVELKRLRMAIRWALGEAADELETLRIAIINLSNEILGSLPLMEPLCRREFGNTNYNLLIQRAEEARTITQEQSQ